MSAIEKKIFISAGDSSGDIHGANLMRCLTRRDPDIKFYGLGKENMVQTGLQSLHDMSKKSLMWLHVLTELSTFIQMKRDCVRFFKEERPYAVILIDYCGFNLHLARAAKKLKIPVVYYICPQLWAHGSWRIKKMKKWVDKLLVIYPFEKPFYESAGIPVTYVGHPLFDEIQQDGCNNKIVEEMKEHCGNTVVSLLPGSRKQEIVRLLPLFLKASVQIHQKIPSVRFLISCSNEHYYELIYGLAKECRIPYKIVKGNIHELINASDLCIASAGTVTLQLAYYLKPMIIVYKISSFGYFIAKPFLDTPYIGLVNKLANKMIVPEILMFCKNISWLVNQATQLLVNEQKRQTCIQELTALIKTIGQSGASEHAADEILNLLGSKGDQSNKARHNKHNAG